MRDIAKIIRRTHAKNASIEVEIVRVPQAGQAHRVFWRFTRPPDSRVIQVESPDGMCPFILGSSQGDARLVGTSIPEVVEIICSLLKH
ncbi:MAG TPA: hypothetical protein VK150_03930 [Geothrix sp.]|nr:hypothetical protein [Geothrix sp.]